MVVNICRWISSGMVVTFGMASLGCGEASVHFRGAILSGDASAYTFDDASNPRGLVPIEGASVHLHIVFDEKTTCREERRIPERESRYEFPEKIRDYARTDAGGNFKVDSTFGWMPTEYVLICADKSGYVPFVYKVVFGKSRDPMDGQKAMNIVLGPIRAVKGTQ